MEDSATSGFILLKQACPRVPETKFPEPVSLDIRRGDIWTFYGPNGSGKTLLAELICGKYGLEAGEISYPFMDELRRQGMPASYPRQFIRLVSFRSTYSLSDFREAYYQQRFQALELDAYPTVETLLQVHPDAAWRSQVTEWLNLTPLLKHHLITLSSGQLRRLLIAKALLEQPCMLIFDNPFIGLDEDARTQLNAIFLRLQERGVQLLFLVPVLRDIPPCTTHVLQLDACYPRYCGELAGFRTRVGEERALLHPRLTFPPSEEAEADYRQVVDMRHVSIRYGQVVYQPDINWTIARGEKWALLGPNGSGKSTLLSYIFADNPQGYGQPLYLFDRKRGSGESIWDIKKRIGYTSAEMHLYYNENVSCLKVVESGFFDSIGLFRTCTAVQEERALQLLQAMGLAHLAARSFLRVSSGEQRLLLFLRALIKNPELLILDEPFHGMDYVHKQACLQLIEAYAGQSGKSMIFVTHYPEEIPACVQHIYPLAAPAALHP